jgi:nucleotide-binding universal stress UspA family protein
VNKPGGIVTLTSILLYVDANPASDTRIDLAFRLAQRCDAYVAAAGLEEVVAGPGERFNQLLRQEQLQGEWQTIIGLPVAYLTRHACAYDLVIVGQRDGQEPTGLDAPEEVVLGCGRPVLIVPNGFGPRRIGGHVLIAWNGSREAMRAVQDALPLMALCDGATVLLVNPEEDADVDLQSELIDHLARHGLKAFPETTRAATGVIADAVLDRAAQLNADVIVMGAFGHSRLRETILGGMTRDMLFHAGRPLLMSH